ncbi:MAG: FAD-dependent oxidoreductase, partial [Phycisphaerae bacterium]|nr:FAD-dependent oxidoreductase [Phycisphaerae bacterium]
MKTYCTIAVLALAILAGTSAGGDVVLLEAEGFDELGGWKLDQQFMDQMGSPILLAHGMGVPVKDATTAVTFPATGEYQLWVRTRDWVAGWKAPGAPGKFRVLIDGKPIEKVFGTEGAKWRWHRGGPVKIAKTKVTVSLHDLTGFDGRCDAIVFASDAKFVPPAELKVMTPWRRKLLGISEKPIDAGKFDLVVVGGGIAGTCSAISGARSGLKVALIQDRPVLGGNNSSETRVHLGGRTMLAPYPALGGVVRELSPAKRGNAGPPERYEDQKKLNVVAGEKNISLFLSTHVSEVETDGKKIVAVIGRNIRTGKRLRFSGRVFADCTGDGTVGFLAGADFRMGREGKDETGEALAPKKA